MYIIPEFIKDEESCTWNSEAKADSISKPPNDRKDLAEFDSNFSQAREAPFRDYPLHDGNKIKKAEHDILLRNIKSAMGDSNQLTSDFRLGVWD